MAERRMFAKTIIDSDAFLEMPQSTQLLYFHLSMRADDEGFVNKPKTIMRMLGSKDDDVNILILRKFILPFESGVVVIKHWKIHNYLQNDRIVPTKYTDEKSQLELDDKKAYRLVKDQCIQNASKVYTQVSIGKNSIDKISKEEDSHTLGEFKNVKLSEEEYSKIKELGLESYIERVSAYIAQTGKRYKSHYATILNWSRKDSTPKRSGRVELQTEYKEVKTNMSNEEQEALAQRFAELGGL